MSDKYIFLLLEYSMCFTLCTYQNRYHNELFHELYPALAVHSLYLLHSTHVYIAPVTEAEEHLTEICCVIEF